MKLAFRLNADGLVRALRTAAHTVAEAIESTWNDDRAAQDERSRTIRSRRNDIGSD